MLSINILANLQFLSNSPHCYKITKLLITNKLQAVTTNFTRKRRYLVFVSIILSSPRESLLVNEKTFKDSFLLRYRFSVPRSVCSAHSSTFKSPSVRGKLSTSFQFWLELRCLGEFSQLVGDFDYFFTN